MMRKAAAFLCLAAAATGVIAVAAPPAPERIEVLVAARELRAGQVVRAEDLRLGSIDRAVLPVLGEVLSAADSATGRRVAAPIQSGEAVTVSRLVPRSPAEGLPVATVAAYLNVAQPGALDLMTVGSRVRIYPAYGGPVLARDAPVLAVERSPRESGDGTDPAPQRSGAIIVALTDAQVDQIYAGERPDGSAPTVVPVLAR